MKKLDMHTRGEGNGKMVHLKNIFTKKNPSSPYSPLNGRRGSRRILNQESNVSDQIISTSPKSKKLNTAFKKAMKDAEKDETSKDVEIKKSDSSNSGNSIQSASTVGSNATFSSIMSGFTLSSFAGKGTDDGTVDAFMGLNGKNIPDTNTVKLKAKDPIPLEKYNAAAHASALSSISSRNFSRFLEIVNKSPSILLCKTERGNTKLKGADGGTLLHVLVSQKPKLKKKRLKQRHFSPKAITNPSYEVYVSSSVPEKLLEYVIKLKPEALEIKDSNGHLPIHCAVMSLAAHLDEMSTIYGNKATDKIGSATYEVSRFVVGETNKIRILLKNNSTAASVVDREGNLPIHYAANFQPDYSDSSNTIFKGKKYGPPSAVDAMKKLLSAYPRGVIIENKSGMMPIHILVSMGKSINLECLRMMLQHHQVERDLPTERDRNGDPPLFGAIKSGASNEVIKLFAGADESSNSSRFFIQRDRNNNNPLHAALLQGSYPNVDLLHTILDVAPFTASSPDSHGVMPIVRATQVRLEESLIKKILARDMPIEIGIDEGELIPFGDDTGKKQSNSIRRNGPNFARHVVGRTHHHSWWFILVECQDYYCNVVERFLSKEATHFQIVSLARQVGPDGKSILINCVSDRCRLMFHSLLRFYDRYEILLSTNETKVRCDDIVDGVQTFLALDHGPMPSSFDAKNPSTMLSTNAVKVQRFNKKDPEVESEVEVSLLSKEGSKVLLRCYMYEEAFFAELKVREKYGFPSNYFEEMLNHHRDESFTHLTLSKSDKLCCATFERPDHTLADVFASVSGGARSKKWVEKCWVVLNQIAEALKCLHDQNLVHGHLDPTNICKYGNVWKISKVGTVVKNGAPMRGTFRSSVPPESIIKSTSRTNNTKTMKASHSQKSAKKTPRVKFSPGIRSREEKTRLRKSSLLDRRDDDAITKTSHTSDDRRKGNSNDSFGSLFQFTSWPVSNEHTKTNQTNSTSTKDMDVAATFAPERVKASPVWDIWGFGLIMTQMLLGRCMYLSNFEKADDAIMKKLQNYDEDTLLMICNQLHKAVGKDASDLVYSMLQKDPKNRVKSMDQVLGSAYFKSLTIYM